MPILAFAGALLALAQFDVRPDLPESAERGPFGFDLDLPFGERLLSYRWDDGPSVPYLGSAGLMRIPFGELGVDPGTRVYLPASSFLEPEVTGTQVVASLGLDFAPGRYGQALAFGARSYLRLALSPTGLATNGWTLSFWIRPEAGALGRSLVLMPGALEVRLQGDGSVRAELLPSGPSRVQPAPLALERWAYVSVTYDPEMMGEMRLFVNDTAVLAVLDRPASLRVPSELLLGDLAGNGQGLVARIDELALVPGSQSTSQAARRVDPRPLPGTHRLTFTTSRGVRTVSPAASVLTTSLLARAEDFERGRLEGAVVQDGVLRWAPARWHEIRTPLTPPARTTHPLVSLEDGRLFTFGGETRDTHLPPMRNTDDTWIFDGSTERWTRIRTASAPSPRCHVPAAYSPDHDLVLLVGGWRNDTVPGQTFGDTWVYHVKEERWEQRFPSGAFGGTFSDHGLVYLPQLRRFLLLRNGANWLYDPEGDRWQALPPATAVDESGAPVSYTIGASTACVLDPRSGLVVTFGGSYGPSSSVFSDTTTLYDVSTNTYTVLAPPLRPSPRVRGASCFDPRFGALVYFGGVQDQFSERYDDLWGFDMATRRWTELPCSNRPSERGGYYGMAYDAPRQRFLLWGGRNSSERWLDETLALELDPGRAGWASYTFERLDGRGRHWSARTSTPGDSRVDFLFRAGAADGQWSAWKLSPELLGAQRYLQVAVFLRPGTHGEIPSVERMELRP